LVGLLLVATPALALRVPEGGETPAGPRAYCLATWDNSYLYLAANVEDPMLAGTSTEPMSSPWSDDSVEFALEVHRGDTRIATTRVTVSAAGGFYIQSLGREGVWRADPSWITPKPPSFHILKVAVVTDGTLNNSNDVDRGYTVEMAIPWDLLGGPPQADPLTAARFNFVCRTQGEGEATASWASGLKTEAELGDPSKWGAMLFSPAAVAPETQPDVMIAPRARSRSPMVDGKLEAGEWLNAARIFVVKPAAQFVPGPPATRPGGGVSGNLVMALYYYWYQADPRSPPQAGSHVRAEDGRWALTDQPREAAGPWMSYDRASWHKEQLEQLQQAGVDVILPVYRGDPASRATYALRGLDALVEALKEVEAAGHSHPLVGLYVDTEALAQVAGPDLTTPAAQQQLYGMIREFYERIPPSFRAGMGAKQPGTPILLGSAAPFTAWDGGFFDYCNQAFARDFAGGRLTWLADPGWDKTGLTGIEGFPSVEVSGGLRYSEAGAVSVVTLSPGFDPSGLPGGASPIRSRGDGRAYSADWTKAAGLRAGGVLLVSWNDFGSATEIAPSRQYGFQYLDLTRRYATQLAGRGRRLRLCQSTVPETLVPGRSYDVELIIENVGTEDLATTAQINVEHIVTRQRDGAVVYINPVAQGLRILAGQTVRVPLRLKAETTKGSPLAKGEYEFSLRVVRHGIPILRSTWAKTELARVTIPFKVGDAPERRARFLATTTHTRLAAGARYPVRVTLRNDGSRPWPADRVKLGYHWYRVRDDLAATSAARAQLIGEGLRAKLPQTVKVGQQVSVEAWVETATANGPLAVSEPGPGWHYQIGWDLVDLSAEAPARQSLGAGGSAKAEGDDGWFAGRGGAAYNETVEVVAADPGPRFVDSDSPKTMAAGAAAQIRLVLKNTGPAAWPADTSRVTYHWYYWDGTEARWEGEKTPLTAPVNPGDSTMVMAALRGPAAPGWYWLMWDFEVDGRCVSTLPSTRSGDSLRQAVQVTGGRLEWIPLDKMVNIVASTSDLKRSEGDLDGRGDSFPAEMMPPDLSGAEAYPSGYYTPAKTSADITFRYPAKSEGTTGAVSCRGQQVPLAGPVRILHLLGAAIGPPQPADFVLHYADGTTETQTLTMTFWLEPASPPATTALVTSHLHRGNLDWTDAAGYLHHYQLAVRDPGRALAGLELPTRPDLKIFAVTIERPQEPAIANNPHP